MDNLIYVHVCSLEKIILWKVEIIKLTFYPMSILWKLKSLLFQLLLNYEKCINTDETWHKCWLNHNLCYNMLNLKFPVTMATGGRLKIAKNHYFALVFFPSKLISKCCNFSMQWDRVKDFSVLFTRHLKINLRPFLSCHKSQTEGGTYSLLATPWCIILMGGHAEKMVTF
jgi:hypothetical protein